MRRSRTVFILVVGALAVTVGSACNKADAASGAASNTAGPSVAVATPATTVAAVVPVAASMSQTAGSVADSLSDSLLIFRADHGRILGKDSAPIWVVMISDFQCPYCKQWHDAALESVKRDYIDKGRVRMAYLNLPLQQHKYSRAESEASMCASVQNQFWPFADALFQRQPELEKRTAPIQPLIDSIARGLKLNMIEFAKCQRRDAIRALVESDLQQASKAGVRSTPSFLVGDFLVEGAIPYADFRKAIDTALIVARNAKRTR